MKVKDQGCLKMNIHMYYTCSITCVLHITCANMCITGVLHVLQVYELHA